MHVYIKAVYLTTKLDFFGCQVWRNQSVDLRFPSCKCRCSWYSIQPSIRKNQPRWLVQLADSRPCLPNVNMRTTLTSTDKEEARFTELILLTVSFMFPISQPFTTFSQKLVMRWVAETREVERERARESFRRLITSLSSPLVLKGKCKTSSISQ